MDAFFSWDLSCFYVSCLARCLGMVIGLGETADLKASSLIILSGLNYQIQATCCGVIAKRLILKSSSNFKNSAKFLSNEAAWPSLAGGWPGCQGVKGLRSPDGCKRDRRECSMLPSQA